MVTNRRGIAQPATSESDLSHHGAGIDSGAVSHRTNAGQPCPRLPDDRYGG
jgi:hypothetical protein